ncbi:MAG: radical SAM protein [Planctomycetota bacterium]
MSRVAVPERLSIELTNRCAKACSFCYNRSHPEGTSEWSVPEVVALARDCARHGTRSVSFGGGEPLEFEGVFLVLSLLDGVVFRSITTNGLRLLDCTTWAELIRCRPDKVHVSVHFPEETPRAIDLCRRLESAGIRSGVNLLVRRSQLIATRQASRDLRAARITNDRIVYVPMRGDDAPRPADVAAVAEDQPFQSTSCLVDCGASSRFCSLGYDRHVAWCSYTRSRVRLTELSARGLRQALTGLAVGGCSLPVQTQPPVQEDLCDL